MHQPEQVARATLELVWQLRQAKLEQRERWVRRQSSAPPWEREVSAASALMQQRTVSKSARPIFGRQPAEQESLSGPEIRAFVSSPIFDLLATALPWQVFHPSPEAGLPLGPELAWLVRPAPAHSAQLEV